MRFTAQLLIGNELLNPCGLPSVIHRLARVAVNSFGTLLAANARFNRFAVAPAHITIAAVFWFIVGHRLLADYA